MYPIERKQAILQLINDKKSISVSQLSASLYIGEATVRRDLAALEKLGQIRRTHGGAIALGGFGAEIPLDFRQSEQIKSKVQMCKTASELIKSGMTVFIDGSSSCLKILPHLNKLSHITVITNGAKTAYSCAEYENINLICLGGLLNRRSSIYEGEGTLEQISALNADVFLFSAKAISMETEVTDSLLSSSAIKRAMLKKSKVKALLVDSSKFDSTAMSKICEISELDYIISDIKPSKQWQSHLSTKNVKFLY